MRLKRSLMNLAKPALLFFSLALFLISLPACQNPLEPTYKEKDIPSIVKKICKEEYGLDVTTIRAHTTLWIYTPVTKLLHEEYGIKEDKIFSEEMLDKLRNILTTVGRVLLSSDNAPEFFAIVASDINIGLDYIIIGNVLDLKKAYAGFIPEMEVNRRYVIKLAEDPKAKGDVTGSHFQAYDVRLADFLAEQMAQRIGSRFQEEGQKKFFKVEKSEGRFSDGTFILEYSIEQIAKPPKEIDIKKEILDIITYCIKTYEFRDFSQIEIADLITQDRVILNKASIWAKTIK